MNQSKALTAKKEIATKLIQVVLLIGLSTLSPLIHNQSITGTLVNAVLYISTILLGPEMAILTGLFPSIIALSVGLLPLALAPIIPFIIISNIILVLTFNFLKEKSYWTGVLVASGSKFLFLFSVSSIFTNFVSKKNFLNIAATMQLPQLLTAISGGVVAYFFLQNVKSN